MRRRPFYLVAWVSLAALGCGDDAIGAGGEGGAPSATSTDDVTTSVAPASGSPSSSDASSPSSSSTGLVGPPCDVDGVAGVCVDVHDCVGDLVPIPGHCDGPAEIQCCVPAGSVACDPSSAPLPNEGLVEAPGDEGCPRGMASLGSFCIDRFEASLVDDQGGSLSPYHNPGAIQAFAVSIAGAVPQGYISGDEAADACAASAKRLCTDEEWLTACRGPSDFDYPYGDVLELGRCNDHRAVHPAIELFMTTDPSIYAMLDNACLNQLEDSLARTGDFADCVTEAGVFDLMGNLHEWTSDPAGTFRGGFYVDTMLNGPGCRYATTAHDTGHWDYSTGFRCCAELIP